MNTKIIIFGCGKLGHEALNVLGSDNVECFCDNNPVLIGSEQYGKRVISFAELKEKCGDMGVIICANVRFGNAWAMAQQCEENGIGDYFFWQTVRGKDIFQKEAQLLSYLDSSVNRKQLKSEVYIQRGAELQKQLKYLRRHIDIRHMKPAGGKLRERQFILVEAAAELLEKLSELEIRPFLYGGNLLGYVRHNGFVPWDDDIDFALMREEYEKLREFCRANMYTKAEFQSRERSNKVVREELKKYYYGNGGGDEFNIIQELSDGSRIVIDFFVLDYYEEDYSFDALMKWREEVKIELNNAILDKGKAGGALYDDNKRIKCFQKALLENRAKLVKESNHIYFGIDNSEIMHSFHRGTWIPKEVVFPLKKVFYEGQYFWVPNDSEEFVKYEYENIWELPDDIGIPQHAGDVADILADKENW